MSGYSNPERPDERLSTAERDAAVGHLAEAQSAGRLTAAEFSERSAAARAAVTRADLVPLFADLPESAPAEAQLPPAGAIPGAGFTSGPGAPYGYGDASVPSSGRGGTRALGGAVGATIMALVPIVAFALFMIFGFVGSFTWSWVFFLLVPIAGIVIYGPGSAERRSR
ncbi:DUF1707 SHOCT-like domain-containing protein [Agromyces atrinae]|nr:DUF1707 domain-containing protein [Agromyces atrinae]NYD67582.1 hypothetical protein [Agromyces atrinae]